MTEDLTRVTTGIDGLDEVLHGGLIENRSYVVAGRAGAGKTILALAFLDAGVRAGETALFVNLEEDLADLKANARAVGIDVDGIEFFDLSPSAEAFTDEGSYDVFTPDEVESEPFQSAVTEAIQMHNPDRVVVDPVTQLHYLTPDDYQFRRRVLGLSRFLNRRASTVVFTAQESEGMPTEDLQFVSDGLIRLDPSGPVRLLDVPKFRGSGTLGGDHSYRIGGDGMAVFPALGPGERTTDPELETISSGVPEIDDLLNGGIERGTVTIVSGPTGVGKTTLGTQFTKTAAERGERSVLYLFEESLPTFRRRSDDIGMGVSGMVDDETLSVEEIEPLRYSPQEFASVVREQVEARDAEIVMIDGIRGYQLTLQGEEDALTRRLHALGRYLKNEGVTTILIDETTSVTGDFRATDSHVSYLADNIVFLRHLEIDGELRKAIGVLKKRTSGYERTLREFEITEDGVQVGDPLRGMRGILSGTPSVDEN
ncbi:MAG: ATPase domain-containing protein [Halobaculum sp.]